VDLSITSEARGDSTVVHVGGEIDVYTAPALRERLDEHISAGRHHLVVDLGDVTFMASTGLGVLVGRLRLVRAASRVFRTWMSVGWLGVAWRRSAGRSAASGRVLGFVECL
jgi:anti-anti-sigma factor